MSSDLLSSPLIRKYFGCEEPHKEWSFHYGGASYCNCQERMSYRILTAMQENFEDKEHYLLWDRWSGEVIEKHGGASGPAQPFKVAIRIPSRFQPPPQKKECPCTCHIHERLGYRCVCTHLDSCSCEECVRPHRAKECNCTVCDGGVVKKCVAVESKIKSIRFLYGDNQLSNDSFENELRALVSLAQSAGRKK